jgi:hypothetical protein
MQRKLFFSLSFLFVLLQSSSMVFAAGDPNPSSQFSKGPGGAMTEGVIEYAIDADNLDPQLAPFLENMTMRFEFSGDMVRAETNMGAMGTTTVISAGGQTVTLMNMMGNKMALNESPEDPEMEVNVTYTDSYKEILGYKCRKAVVEAAGTTMSYWVTDQIQLPKIESNILVKELEGHPLEMELSLGNMTVMMKATSVEAQKVAKARFDTTIPEGYQVMTAEELQQLMGGMGQ